MIQRYPEEWDSAFVKDYGKNEEIDRSLSPEPVGSVQSENPGNGRKESRNDLGIGEATDADIIEEASYASSIGLGEDSACKSQTDPCHAYSSLPEDGKHEESDEVAVRSQVSYTFLEQSLERSEALGFGHLAVSFRF
jgi:hypothetical protein